MKNFLSLVPTNRTYDMTINYMLKPDPDRGAETCFINRNPNEVLTLTLTLTLTLPLPLPLFSCRLQKIKKKKKLFTWIKKKKKYSVFYNSINLVLCSGT